MRSSSGAYFIGLDHVRGLAAFMVFCWHFIHVNNQHLAQHSFPPLSLLTEGHTGVALFMTLSGYLFAKLLDGRAIRPLQFFANRCIRLLPLLLIVLAVKGVLEVGSGRAAGDYINQIAAGIVRPTLPNGGWSVTVEFHFYILLPALLLLMRRSAGLLILIIVAFMMLRAELYQSDGNAQGLAYWTIVGRIDQFVLGMAAFRWRAIFTGRHAGAIGVLFSLMLLYWAFEQSGGFYQMGGYPSPSPIWIYMPTLEGAAYGALIAWYDNSFRHSTGRISHAFGVVGKYSYSIYLLHFFVVFKLGNWIDAHITPLDNPYTALFFAALFFPLFVLAGHVSYVFIEEPFLKMRRQYLTQAEPAGQRASADGAA